MRRMLWALVCLLCAFPSLADAQSSLQSPTIRGVIQNQRRHQVDLRSFWQRITAEGTPLIEPIEGDSARRLVTFLWRGDPNTRKVGVVATITRNPIEPMTHLPGTDVWYFSTPVPAGARFAYRLAVNAPFVTEAPLVTKLLAALQGDPLNRHPWGCPLRAAAKDCQSAVEMPGAPAQPWAMPGDAPKGSLTKLRFNSERLPDERTITVYTPAGYMPGGKPSDLLVVFDEGAYLSVVPTPVILDNLIAAKRIPPTVAVFIGNPSAEARTVELAGNQAFVDALADEFLPWVRERFTVTREASHVTAAGSSLGGLAAVFVALRHPDRFGNVLSQSGDFSWSPDHQHAMGHLAGPMTETGWMAKQFIASPLLPIKFYLDAGVFEADQFATGGMILETNRHMRDVLLAKGYAVTYQQFVGGHDYLSWRGTFADGLIALRSTQQQ